MWEESVNLTITRDLKRYGTDDAVYRPDVPVWEGTLDLSQGSGKMQIGAPTFCPAPLRCDTPGACPEYAPLTAADCADLSSANEASCGDMILRETYSKDGEPRARLWDRRTRALLADVEFGEFQCPEALDTVGRRISGRIPPTLSCTKVTRPCE